MHKDITLTSEVNEPFDDIVQNCKKCNLPIYEGHAYELGDDRWHINCFKCSKCNSSLGCNSNFLVLGNGNLICSNCSYNCKQCGKKIDDLAILTGDQAYCSSCFKCRACKQKIEDLRYARTSKGLFCMNCHEKLMIKKKKYDKKKKQLLKERETRETKETKEKELDSGSVEEDEKPLYQPRHIMHPSTSMTYNSNQTSTSINSQSRSDFYDLYDRSRTPTPKLDEMTRNSSITSKDKDLPITPVVPTPKSAVSSALNDTTNIVNNGSSNERSLDPNNKPGPPRREREFSIEEIVDSDDELNRRPQTPPIMISHNPITPIAHNIPDSIPTETTIETTRNPDFDLLQPALDLKLKPDSPSSVSHTKFQGKNLLILSPGQKNSGVGSPGSGDSASYDRTTLIADSDKRSNCPSPMAKQNRHARVVEEDVFHDVESHYDNDEIDSLTNSSDEHLTYQGTVESSVPESTDFSTPKKKISTPNQHFQTSVISPPPRAPLPSMPDTTTPREDHSTPNRPSARNSTTTPRELNASDRYYLDALTNGHDDLLSGLGLEGVEYNEYNDLKKSMNNRVVANPTPSVTNLEDDYSVNNVTTSPDLGRKQSVMRTPRLGLRHKRSTSGGSSSGIKLNFFKKDDKGHSRHVSDGSISAPFNHSRSNSENLNIHIVPGLNSNSHGIIPSHSRGASYDFEGDLKSMRLEVNQLDSTKKNLMKDIRKLQEDRQKLNNELETMKLKYNEEFKRLSQVSREVQDMKSQRRDYDAKSSSSQILDDVVRQNSNNSSSSLINNIGEEEVETQKATATKLKFWRRAKISNGPMGNNLQVNGSNNTATSPSKEEEEGKRGFLMSKSRSTNILDSFLGNNGNSNSSIGQNSIISEEDDAPLFNSSIEKRSKYENNSIPMIISRCIKEVEERGLDMEGIYRISGGNSAIQAIEVAFSNINTNNVNDKSHEKLNEILDCDINAITSALKRYLRKIPDPLIPYDLYSDFIRLNLIPDESRKIQEFRAKIIQKLPNSNRSVLEVLCKHLELVNAYNNLNRMNFKNLSVVFAPTLARDETGQREMLDMGHRNEITEFLFLHHDEIFI